MEQYVNDICGVVQMLAFSSPTPDSFASAVAENILQPFAKSASSLVFDILMLLLLRLDLIPYYFFHL